MPNEKKNWTIYDIAREAGVTAKTVSRVLNNKPGVGQAMRQRILTIMESVDYHPHIGARALRGKGKGSIGVTASVPLDVVPLSQEFFFWLFSELYRIFAVRGEYISFDMNPFFHSAKADYARGIWEHLCKACIVVGPLASDDVTMRRIHASGVPYVAFGRLDSLPECSCATVDYEEGAYLSTRFLLERGHRRIGMLQPFTGFQPGVERYRGYMRAFAETGVEPDEGLIHPVTFDPRSIINATHRLMLDHSVTALLDCGTDEDSSSLREGARRAGRILATDVEMIAWTYIDQAVVLPEAVAHLWLPVREAAAEGIEKLAAWLDGECEGPFNIVYRPILNVGAPGREAPRPTHLFDITEL